MKKVLSFLFFATFLLPSLNAMNNDVSDSNERKSIKDLLDYVGTLQDEESNESDKSIGNKNGTLRQLPENATLQSSYNLRTRNRLHRPQNARVMAKKQNFNWHRKSEEELKRNASPAPYSLKVKFNNGAEHMIQNDGKRKISIDGNEFSDTALLNNYLDIAGGLSKEDVMINIQEHLENLNPIITDLTNVGSTNG